MVNYCVLVEQDSGYGFLRIEAETPREAAAKITEPHGTNGAKVLVFHPRYSYEFELRERRGFEAVELTIDLVPDA